MCWIHLCERETVSRPLSKCRLPCEVQAGDGTIMAEAQTWSLDDSCTSQSPRVLTQVMECCMNEITPLPGTQTPACEYALSKLSVSGRELTVTRADECQDKQKGDNSRCLSAHSSLFTREPFLGGFVKIASNPTPANPLDHIHTCGQSNENTGSGKGGSQKQKSGSESSTSSAHGSTRGSHRGGRNLSSGSDSDEDGDGEKRRRPPRGLKREPKSKVSFLEEDDDEATDSADEGEGIMDYGSDFGARRVRKESSFEDSSGSVGVSIGTASTITIQSIPKDGRIGASPPQLGSPVNLAVGYGVPESLASHVIDKTPTGSHSGSRTGTPTLDSPRPMEEHGALGTPLLSPEIAPVVQGPPTVPTPSATDVSLVAASIQPSPLPGGGSFNLPFETTWGWQAPVFSPFPLTAGSHAGSVATTPAPTDPSGYLRAGATVLLQGTVCQESDGVLIITVRWRNRTFSGSLIDIGQHEWAPPRLSCGFSEPLVKLKDLYKQREAENQPVNVDVEEDETKETDSRNNDTEIAAVETNMETTETTNEPEPDQETNGQEVGMETEAPQAPPPKAEKVLKAEVVLKPRTRRQSLTLLPKQQDHLSLPENHFSDISDASDNEIEEGPTTQSQPPLPHSLLTTMGMGQPKNGLVPFMGQQGIGSKEQKSSLPRMPSFSSIPSNPPTEVHSVKADTKQASKDSTEDVIPDSQPSSPKESAINIRSTLMSTYPVASTAQPSGVTVTAPGQDHRHSIAGKNKSDPATSSVKSVGTISGGGTHYASLNTLVNVAASMQRMKSDGRKKNPSPLKDYSHSHSVIESTSHQKYPKSTPSNFSISSFTNEDSRGGKEAKRPELRHHHHLIRSTSPRPSTLTPDSKQARSHRSPSPALKKYKHSEQKAPSRPFDASSLPTIVKPHSAMATFGYGPPGIDPTALSQTKEDGHDSDSSGSGSLLSTHRKKKSGSKKKKSTAPLTAIREPKIPKEEPGLKQPETPALAPIPFNAFNVKIQPISPGIEVPLQQQQQQQQLQKDGVFPSMSVVPTTRVAPQVVESPTKKSNSKVASPPSKPPTVGDVMMQVSGELSVHHHQPVLLGTVPPTHKKESKPTASTFAVTDGKGSENQKYTTSAMPVTPGGFGIPPATLQPESLSFVYMHPSQHPRPHPQDGAIAVIQAPSEGNMKNALPNASISGKEPNDRLRSRKRKSGPEVQMEASKRSPPLEEVPERKGLAPLPASLVPSATTKMQPQASKQIFESFEGKEVKMEYLPPGFDYDPNLPMSYRYQLIAFENQQKRAQQKKFQEEYQQMLNKQERQERDELERQKLRAQRQQRGGSKRQRSAEMLNPPQGTPSNSLLLSPQHHQPHRSPPTPPQSKHGRPPSSHSNSSIISGPEMMTNGARIMHFNLPTVKNEPQFSPKSGGSSSKQPQPPQVIPPKQSHPRKNSSSIKKPEPIHVKSEVGDHPLWSGHLPMAQIAGGPFHPHQFIPHSLTYSHPHSQATTTIVSATPGHPTMAVSVPAHSVAIAPGGGAFITSWPSAMSPLPSNHIDKAAAKIDHPPTVASKTPHSVAELLPPHHSAHVGRTSPSPGKRPPSRGQEWHKHSEYSPFVNPSASIGHHRQPSSAMQVSSSSSNKRDVQKQHHFQGHGASESKPHIQQSHIHPYPGPSSSGHHHPSHSSKPHKSEQPSSSQSQQPIAAIQQPIPSPNPALAQLRPSLIRIPDAVMAEEWMKQMQMMQAQIAAMGAAAPQEMVMAWQQQQMLAAQVQLQAQLQSQAQAQAAQFQMDPNMAAAALAFQQQQQQQQQQQSAEVAMANLQAAAAAQNMIHFLHPAAIATPHPALATGGHIYDPHALAAAGVMPFAAAAPVVPTSQKRDN